MHRAHAEPDAGRKRASLTTSVDKAEKHGTDRRLRSKRPSAPWAEKEILIPGEGDEDAEVKATEENPTLVSWVLGFVWIVRRSREIEDSWFIGRSLCRLVSQRTSVISETSCILSAWWSASLTRQV